MAKPKEFDEYPTFSFLAAQAVLKHADPRLDYNISLYLVKQRGERFVSVHTLEGFHKAAPEELTWVKLGYDAEWVQLHLQRRIEKLLLCKTFKEVQVLEPYGQDSLAAWSQGTLEQHLPTMGIQDLAPLFQHELEEVVQQCSSEPTKQARDRLRRCLHKRLHDFGMRWPFRQVESMKRAFHDNVQPSSSK